MLVRLSFLAACFLALGFVAHAQQSGLTPPVAPSAPAFPVVTENVAIGWPTQRQPDPLRALRKKVVQATEMLKKAEDDDSKQTAKDHLEAILEQEYDAHMDVYEAQIEEMEKQIKEMRKKLSRRRDAKSDMVKLRMRMLEAEADDLGWPSAMSDRTGVRLPGLQAEYSFEKFFDPAAAPLAVGVPAISQARQ